MSEAPQSHVQHTQHPQSRDRGPSPDFSQTEARTKVHAPVLALAVITAGIGAMTLATLTSDHQVAAGFDRAVSGPSARTVTTAATPQRTLPPVSGTEAFWLDTRSQTLPLSPAAWTGRAIGPGDRFSFAGGTGRRILEVTEVRQLDLAQTSAATTADPASNMLLVTLRDTANANAAPLRLLLDSRAPLANLTPLGDTPDRDL